MIITIEGDRHQVREACKLIAGRLRVSYRRRLPPEKQKKQDYIFAWRRLVRRAFDLIRYRTDEKLMALQLAQALSGSGPVTTSLVESAFQIVTETGIQTNIDLAEMGMAAHQKLGSPQILFPEKR